MGEYKSILTVSDSGKCVFGGSSVKVDDFVQHISDSAAVREFSESRSVPLDQVIAAVAFAFRSACKSIGA